MKEPSQRLPWPYQGRISLAYQVGPKPSKRTRDRHVTLGSPPATAAQPARGIPALWQMRQCLQGSMGLQEPLATPWSHQEVTMMGCLPPTYVVFHLLLLHCLPQLCGFPFQG